VDADGLIFACATTAEERIAKRAGLATARVGVRASSGVPEGRVVSFGLAGALHEGLRVGDVLDATRVVDAAGATLWEGPQLGVPGAYPAVMLASGSLISDPRERRRLHEATGADSVDMESGVLAASGRLAGVVRVVSDGVESTIDGVDSTVHADGRTNVPALLRWVATRRVDAVRSMRDAVVALRQLERSVA
jgi:nucleoside phosphorylase